VCRRLDDRGRRGNSSKEGRGAVAKSLGHAAKVRRALLPGLSPTPHPLSPSISLPGHTIIPKSSTLRQAEELASQSQTDFQEASKRMDGETRHKKTKERNIAYCSKQTRSCVILLGQEKGKEKKFWNLKT
jgi:hypothetical protein